MAYDRADWHHGGDFPEDLPPENGGTHIGMYLSWALRRGFAGPLHVEHSAEALRRAQDGSLSGRDFLFEACDGKLTSEDLNEEGRAFTDSYYEEHFLSDYAECFADVEPTLYHVPLTVESQRVVDALLDERLAAWRGARKKPWWRLW